MRRVTADQEALKDMERVENCFIEYLILACLAAQTGGDGLTAYELYRSIREPARRMQMNVWILMVTACIWTLKERGCLRQTNRASGTGRKARIENRYVVTDRGRRYLTLYEARMIPMAQFFTERD